MSIRCVRVWRLTAGLISLSAAVPVAQAQVWAVEGVPWQFETAANKANKALVLDAIERKKGGYYDSFQTNYNITNNTYIKRQYNCALTATSTGSAAESGQSATVSSPVTSNTSGNYLDAIGNSSVTGPQENFARLPGTGLNGMGVGAGAGSASANTDQSNTGDVRAGVHSSPSQASSDRIYAGGGQSTQALNVHQSNTGTQTASVSGSTGCDFGSGGVALN